MLMSTNRISAIPGSNVKHCNRSIEPKQKRCVIDLSDSDFRASLIALKRGSKSQTKASSHIDSNPNGWKKYEYCLQHQLLPLLTTHFTMKHSQSQQVPNLNLCSCLQTQSTITTNYDPECTISLFDALNMDKMSKSRSTNSKTVGTLEFNVNGEHFEIDIWRLKSIGIKRYSQPNTEKKAMGTVAGIFTSISWNLNDRYSIEITVDPKQQKLVKVDADSKRDLSSNLATLWYQIWCNFGIYHNKSGDIRLYLAVHLHDLVANGNLNDTLKRIHIVLHKVKSYRNNTEFEVNGQVVDIKMSKMIKSSDGNQSNNSNDSNHRNYRIPEHQGIHRTDSLISIPPLIDPDSVQITDIIRPLRAQRQFREFDDQRIKMEKPMEAMQAPIPFLENAMIPKLDPSVVLNDILRLQNEGLKRKIDRMEIENKELRSEIGKLNAERWRKEREVMMEKVRRKQSDQLKDDKIMSLQSALDTERTQKEMALNRLYGSHQPLYPVITVPGDGNGTDNNVISPDSSNSSWSSSTSASTFQQPQEDRCNMDIEGGMDFQWSSFGNAVRKPMESKPKKRYKVNNSNCWTNEYDHSRNQYF